MAVLFKTIAQEAHVEQIIEKSRFIAHAKPVSSKEEADEFLLSLKKEYKDASHNVPAFVIGDKMQLQWGSDDGEPQGTAGAPIVQMLVKEEITNVAVVVTRYFGGIKLGTGGLVRAYTSSAKLALDVAGVLEVRNLVTLKVKIEYNQLGKLQNFEKEMNFTIVNIEYADMLTIDLQYEAEYDNTVKAMLTELTKGKYTIV